MTFTIVTTITAIAAAALGLGNIFAPKIMITRPGLLSYRTDPHSIQPATVFLSRRMGAVYVGLAVMLIIGRDAPSSRLRDAVCVGFAIALASIALTAIIERAARRVANGILVPTIFEIFLASSFIWVATR